ncbi:MAG: hypothetical protein ACLT1W_02955 [Alistipes onderdonkii]
MKKMILIERSKFALLVRSHMKASNMLLVLQHVCRERRISLSMTQEEVCQLIRLDPDFVEKYKRRGKLCPVEDQDGKQYYNVLDFINLKDMQESKRIFYQTMEQAVPDTASPSMNHKPLSNDPRGNYHGDRVFIISARLCSPGVAREVCDCG